MRPEVRPKRTIDEDHVALRQRSWPLIEGDLSPLWGNGECDADRVQQAVRPRTSHHHDDGGIDRAVVGVYPHDALTTIRPETHDGTTARALT